jgi:hypothetical protein
LDIRRKFNLLQEAIPAGAGTQTAGLAFGGYDGIPDRTNSTEAYDGSTWSPGGNLGTARQDSWRYVELKQLL